MNPAHVPLGPGREFDRIREIATALTGRAGTLGDDCAFVPDGQGGLLALSTDVSVEDVHFRQEWLAWDEIGWRAAAAALSDLAAAAAEPIGLLAALTVPSDATARETAAVMHGVGDAVGAVGGVVLGGDLSRGPVWSLAITVLGRVRRAVGRAGARPGDGVWVTGALGGARAALERFTRGEVVDAAGRRPFARPEPRIVAGRWLEQHGATALIDLSDGLAGDARHVAAASRVALDVELDRLPLAPTAVAEARRLDAPPERFAAEGGEDYELLATLPPTFGDADAEAFRAAAGLGLTRIGRVEPGTGVRFRLRGQELELRGFDHFAGR